MIDQSKSNQNVDWQDRLSLHEMSANDALELSFQTAVAKTYRTASLHFLVTRAISSMVPIDAVPNRALLKIFYGTLEDRDSKRLIRHFRNSERPLKLESAATYIQRLLYARVIKPFEGGRLWYLALLHHAATSVVNEFIGLNPVNKHSFSFEKSREALRSRTCEEFERALENSIKKSRKLPLENYPMNDVRQFMDFGAYEYYVEVSMKRNPLESLHRTFELSSIINQYKFD